MSSGLADAVAAVPGKRQAAHRTPAGVRLRLFRTKDLVRVQSLIYRTIAACYTGVYPPSAVAFFREYHCRKNILADARAGRTFVMEARGRIVGVGTLVGSTIKRVFVEPEFQHRGLGRRLMARLEQAARSAGVRTVVLHASLTSWRLYRKLGYRAGRRSPEPGFTGGRLDYYPMARRLPRRPGKK